MAFCLLFTCGFFAHSAFAKPSDDALLYYINYNPDDDSSALRTLNKNDFSDDHAKGLIDLTNNQYALGASVDPKTGKVYFVQLDQSGAGFASSLAVLHMDTRKVTRVGELTPEVNDEIFSSLAFDDKGQLYGVSIDSGAEQKLRFYKINKTDAAKEFMAEYAYNGGDMAFRPFAFNEDDGLFYVIESVTGKVFTINPSNPSALQEVSSFAAADIEEYTTLAHKSGKTFYTASASPNGKSNIYEVDFSGATVQFNTNAEELDATGVATALFFWPVKMDTEDEDDHYDKKHKNSVYKKAYQRMNYYKEHNRAYYLESQSIYRTYQTAGDHARKVLKETDIDTYNKYKEYRRYKKYKEYREHRKK